MSEGSGLGFNCAREFLRAKFLARGQDECKAYHVTRDGRVICADVESFYLALFARVDDFWKVVASAHGCETEPLASLVARIESADREGRFTCIDCRCGKTYIESVFPDNLPYVYLSARATADEFKKAVIEAQAKASECGKGNDGITSDFH